MTTIPALLTAHVRAAAAAVLADADQDAAFLADTEPVVATNDPRHGDYQSNLAFRLTRALRTSPRAAAERLVPALGDHPAVASIEVAGPGFLNFRLDDAWLAGHVAAVAAEPACGVVQRGAGHTVVIDYSSPNIAKRMHVGHIRSTLIGNALHRLHEAVGYRVVADNHIGDWGTQYGKLIYAWRRWRDDAAYEADPVAELERLYVKFGDVAKAAPEVEREGMDAEARAETAKLQSGDPENRALWQTFVERSLSEYDRVYDRLGVSFDVTLGESFYHDMLADVVDAALAAGVAKKSDGAVIVDFPEPDDKALADTVLVIRKQDGAYLYGTTDLATLQYRMTEWAPSRVVYVTDKRQQLHFKQVFDGWTRLRAATAPTTPLPELEHVWFGTLNFDGGAMSSRKGGTVRLVEYMDEAVERARAVVDEKAAELSDEERADIAEAVGVAAIRYGDLSQNPNSDLEFSLDRMLALDGNTAPFLMYSYARLRRIQAKGEVTEPTVTGLALSNDTERALAVHLARYAEAVPLALATSRPNLLCDYLFELAGHINRFYRQSPVLDAEADVRAARLAMVEAAARVLGHGLRTLGLRPIDRM